MTSNRIKALYIGTLDIAGMKIPRAVLEDERRVVTENAILTILGSRSGASRRIYSEREKGRQALTGILRKLEVSEAMSPYRSRITQAGLTPTHPVTAMDELGDTREIRVAGEFPLTLYVDNGREIVTLMTLGAHLEALALGYLRTQRFIAAVSGCRTAERKTP